MGSNVAFGISIAFALWKRTFKVSFPLSDRDIKFPLFAVANYEQWFIVVSQSLSQNEAKATAYFKLVTSRSNFSVFSFSVFPYTKRYKVSFRFEGSLTLQQRTRGTAEWRELRDAFEDFVSDF